MMAQELVTAVQEKLKVIVVLVQNHGFASIGALSKGIGAQRFGTSYRFPQRGDRPRLDGEKLPIDLASNAESLGVVVHRVTTIPELKAALHKAKEHQDGPVMVHVETDPLVPASESESWWDVPISEVASLDSTTTARRMHEARKARQRLHL
jgi:3D-(3,5/4)-trihydroxycyclohexane-1,2-dione acylhydrolase (decyclizing)